MNSPVMHELQDVGVEETDKQFVSETCKIY
jgi:hypothetical protein